MNLQIPHGWRWASPDELAALERHALGIGPFGSDLKVSDYTEHGVPLVFVRNIRAESFLPAGQPHVSIEKAAQLAAHRVQSGDVLITKMGEPPGDAAVYPEHAPEGRMTADCIRLRVDPRVAIAKFVMYATRAPIVRSQVIEATRGVAQKKISLERFRTIRYPLPPLNTQRQIVDQIDTHFSRLDAAVASLTRAKANVKRARASVLKAAVEGRLLPTEAALARAEGREYEAASVLLKRILAERKEAWAASGARGRYAEPVKPETPGLPGLPEGWCWTSMDALLHGIEAGKSFAAENTVPSATDVGIVKVSAVTWGVYNEDEAKTVHDPELINPGFFVRRGDLLFSRANTIELVGAAVIAERVTRRTMLSDKILRLKMSVQFRRFVLWVLRSQHGRRQIEALATGNQESMRNIGQDRIRQIVLPLPPLAEQHRIVAEVDRRISVLDALDAALDANLARCARLRQAILKLAFEGRLVAAEAPASAPPLAAEPDSAAYRPGA